MSDHGDDYDFEEHWANLGGFPWFEWGVAATQENTKNARTLGRILLANGFSLRWNLRAGCTEIQYRGGEGEPKPWAPFSDRNSAWMREGIGDEYRYQTEAGKWSALRYGVESWAECVNALTALNEIDPFILWLEQLPFWDGEPRIDMLLANLFAADETPLAQWASRFLTLGAVQRAFEPGCKLDEMPVLFAEQGVGKSALLRCLLPEDRPEWFSDQLEFDANAKERAESLLGRVVVEAAELAGVTRADMQTIKAFITRQDDSVRLAYGRYVEQLPRRCVMIGSVDRSDCLPNDPAGLRRWVVVALHVGCHVEQALPPIREQLWAEALDRYQKGERANLPRDLIPIAATAAEEHRSRDAVVEDAIAEADLTSDDGYTLADIAEKIGVVDHGSGTKMPRSLQNQLGAALRNAGFEKKRVTRDSKQRVVWFAPITTLGFGDGGDDGF